MTETYDVWAAYQAQVKYCDEKDLPLFIPEMGVCNSCGQSCFNKSENASTWSVERAGSSLITGCPYCCKSFTD